MEVNKNYILLFGTLAGRQRMDLKISGYIEKKEKL